MNYLSYAFINGYTMIQTCPACPEQYDVIHKNDLVGYIKLRGGRLRVMTPYCIPYECDVTLIHEFKNHELKGCFDNDTERMYYLNKAMRIIIEQ